NVARAVGGHARAVVLATADLPAGAHPAAGRRLGNVARGDALARGEETAHAAGLPGGARSTARWKRRIGIGARGAGVTAARRSVTTDGGGASRGRGAVRRVRLDGAPCPA